MKVSNRLLKFNRTIGVYLIVFLLASCLQKEKNSTNQGTNNEIPVDELLAQAENQLELQIGEAEKKQKIPRTIGKDGEMHWANPKFDWTEGFFPGSLWYLYETSKKEKWKNAAEKFQSMFESHKYLTDNHDLGFIFNVSYGNGYRITENETFKDVMITAADSLSTRFNPKVGCIQSWDVDKGWQSKRDWKFPVIIDNMMNLELLFKASKVTGDPKYTDVAVKHANTTLKNHFRQNNSSFHVVDYDPMTGEVRNKETAQGFADESAWARGQAWGVYGYTVCYRYTKDKRYLEQAKKIAQFIIRQNALQKDSMPYWDYDAKNIPDELVDVSAAAITASALIELDGYTTNSYQKDVENLLTTLASEKYTSKIGDNHNFILMHSVGSIPHGNEIDVPLNYADYYYLEALLRYKNKYPKG